MSLLDDYRSWRGAQTRQRPRPTTPLHDTECRCGTPLTPATAIHGKYCSKDCVPSGGIDYTPSSNRWNWRPEDLNEDPRILVKVNGWDWGDGLTLTVLLPENADDTGETIDAHLRIDDGVHYVGQDWQVPVAVLSDADALHREAAAIAPRLHTQLRNAAAYAARQLAQNSADGSSTESCECCTAPLADEDPDPAMAATRGAGHGWREAPREYVRRIMQIPGGKIYITLVDLRARQGFPLAEIIDFWLPGFGDDPSAVTHRPVTYRIIVPEELREFAEAVTSDPVSSGGFYEHDTYQALQRWLAQNVLGGHFWRIPNWAMPSPGRDDPDRLTII